MLFHCLFQNMARPLQYPECLNNKLKTARRNIMSAALPMNLIDLPMDTELDQAAMQNVAGGHSAGTSVKYSYYTTMQTQSIGFLKRHRRKYHHTRVTTRKWHSYGAWTRWHVHF